MVNFYTKIGNVINCKKLRTLSRYHNMFRGISTSQKTGEVDAATMEKGAPGTNSKKKIRNWQSYGYDYIDQRTDYFRMHIATFTSVVVILWGTFFLISYQPDIKDFNWAAREARIQVRKREVLGLPYVDPNYIDPALIKLPPDEEIPQEDIII